MGDEYADDVMGLEEEAFDTLEAARLAAVEFADAHHQPVYLCTHPDDGGFFSAMTYIGQGYTIIETVTPGRA